MDGTKQKCGMSLYAWKCPPCAPKEEIRTNIFTHPNTSYCPKNVPRKKSRDVLVFKIKHKASNMIRIRKRPLKDGRFSVYLDIHYNGVRKKERLPGIYLTGTSSDRETMKTIEAIKAHRLLELTQNEYDFLATYGKDQKFTPYFSEMAKRKNLDKNLSVVKLIEAFTPGVRFREISVQWAERFVEYLRKPQLKKADEKIHPYAETTISTILTEIKLALNEAVREGLINKNPLAGLKIKRVAVVKEFLTTEELQKLFNANCPNAEVKRAFLFACNTGLRISDITKLKLTDIDNGHITIKQQKTGVVNRIPLNETATKILEDTIPTVTQAIFRMPPRATIHYMLREWIAAAGINKRVTFHTARHTFATQLITYGADIYTVSKLLGHTDVKITQVYAKLVDEKKIDAVSSLPKIG